MRNYLFISLMFIMLTGCGVVAPMHNTNMLGEINLGDSYHQVSGKLMGPRRTESFYELGHEFEIMKAKIKYPKGYTYLVFMDDALLGYGDSFYARFNKARQNPSVFSKMIDQLIMAPPTTENHTTEQITPSNGGI